MYFFYKETNSASNICEWIDLVIYFIHNTLHRHSSSLGPTFNKLYMYIHLFLPQLQETTEEVCWVACLTFWKCHSSFRPMRSQMHNGTYGERSSYLKFDLSTVLVRLHASSDNHHRTFFLYFTSKTQISVKTADTQPLSVSNADSVFRLSHNEQLPHQTKVLRWDSPCSFKNNEEPPTDKSGVI